GPGRRVLYRAVHPGGTRRGSIARLRGGTIDRRSVRLSPDQPISEDETRMSGDKVCSARVRFNIAAFLAALGLLVGTGTTRVFAQSGQVTFEKAVADLSSQDGGTRLRAVQLLKAAGYPEAAVPMAPVILDPFDETQLEAIAAELNIFLADRVIPKKRVGLLVEVRNAIAAEPIFAAGP